MLSGLTARLLPNFPADGFSAFTPLPMGLPEPMHSQEEPSLQHSEGHTGQDLWADFMGRRKTARASVDES